MPLSNRFLTWLALAIYFCWGIVFILQKPGMHEDEALLVSNAIHMDLNIHGGDPAATNIRGWITLPLMSIEYIGAVKDYLTVPFIEIFGVRTALIRLVSLLLGAFGIWGVARLMADQVSPAAGSATALVLAISPSYLNMVVFDNSGIGGMMASFGILCAAFAWYLRSPSARTAWWLGAAVGFGIWARANFLWTEIAAGAGLLVVYRRQTFAHLSRSKRFVYGALLAGSPFLLYQLLSGGLTWTVQQGLQAKEPLASLFSYRSFLFAEVLLSEGEHRVMWGASALPPWQLWLFPTAIVVACIVCLFLKPAGGAGRVAVVTLLVSALFLFTTRLEAAEHHFIILVPLAAIVAVIACHSLNVQFKAARWGVAAFAVLYCGCALYWNIETVRGLHRTGGKGDWSDAITTLANYLDHRPAGEFTTLDWGLGHPIYVLTRGRQTPRAMYWDDSEPQAGHPSWKEVIDRGGVFLLTSPQNRHFHAAADGFLKAIDQIRPSMHRQSFFERDGTPFAEVIEIESGSSKGKVAAP
jgi:hypothetical protein